MIDVHSGMWGSWLCMVLRLIYASVAVYEPTIAWPPTRRPMWHPTYLCTDVYLVRLFRVGSPVMLAGAHQHQPVERRWV